MAPRRGQVQLGGKYIVADATGGPYHGRIYVNGNSRVGRTAGALTTFYSGDGGNTFTESRMPTLPKAATMGNAVVLSNGTVVGLYATARSPLTKNRAETPSWLQVSRSTDGGQSFEPQIEVASGTLVVGRKGGHNNTMALPVMAVDASTGRYKDRLYVVWPEYRDATPTSFSAGRRTVARPGRHPGRVNDAPEPRAAASADCPGGVSAGSLDGTPGFAGACVRLEARSRFGCRRCTRRWGICASRTRTAAGVAQARNGT